MHDRQIGTTGIRVSAVALGCWPIAGITSVDVNEADNLATLRACRDLGINFLDTAYVYGYEGESERLICRALGDCRDDLVIATKGGIHWEPDRSQAQDACPATLIRQCEESLQRLGTDRVELYYLHSPDPNVPVADSAGAIQQLIDEGKVISAGISNATVEQIEEFHAVCPLSAVQPPYNMLQRGIEREIIPWCRSHEVSVMVFWPLMKGLLAGRMTRQHDFAPDDKRTSYPMYQGEEWQKNQDFLDDLREIAADAGKTVAQVVVNWTIHRPGITVALCGAKRAYQIEETAGALGWHLNEDQLDRIDQALERRGTAASRRTV